MLKGRVKGIVEFLRVKNMVIPVALWKIEDSICSAEIERFGAHPQDIEEIDAYINDLRDLQCKLVEHLAVGEGFEED